MRVEGLGFGLRGRSYLRLIDSCITQLKAHGPSRTCNESQEEVRGRDLPLGRARSRLLALSSICFGLRVWCSRFGVWGLAGTVQYLIASWHCPVSDC